MYTISSNFADVAKKIISKLEATKDSNNPVYIPRMVAAAVLPKMRNRIFVEGKDSDGKGIGTYSSNYLEYRKAKGKGSSPNVKLFFTRELQNDLSVIPDGDKIDIGFKNPTNFEISVHLEEKYQKHIFTKLTKEELQLVIDVAEDELNKLLK